MFLGVQAIRDRVAENVKVALESDLSDETKAVLKDWLDNKDESAGTRERANALVTALENCDSEIAKTILNDKEFFVKRSQWIFGGDGWAYDIGYGGLDHVLASGDNVNVLVFDTEVYSNTGGQSSKATPTAAIAKFAASGKRTKKKDLGRMMMSYGNVYVAQVAIGADKNQVVKAMLEAEAHNGPSIIIAYSTCISHGLKKGMGFSIRNMDEAVKAGYWHLYRYNPELKEQGKNPFSLDSKEPQGSFRDFIMDQVRYSAIAKQFPEQAEELFQMTEEHARQKYAELKKLAEQE